MPLPARGQKADRLGWGDLPPEIIATFTLRDACTKSARNAEMIRNDAAEASVDLVYSILAELGVLGAPLRHRRETLGYVG